MLWLKTVLFTLIAPGVVTVLVPRLILGPKAAAFSADGDSVSVLGLAVAAAGVAVYLWCAVDFIRNGRGTPAPYDPPKTLVVNGLYRTSRNPMYVGVASIILGEAILFRAGALWAYAALVGLAFHLRVLWYEEPALRRLFGESYVKYCAEVPRWLPLFFTGKPRGPKVFLTMVLAFAAGNGACEFEWPKAAPPMAAAKFAEVYVALLHIAEGDSLPPARADSVFQAQGVARKDFEAAARYYNAQAEQWSEVMKLVVAQLDSQLAKETRKMLPQSSQ